MRETEIRDTVLVLEADGRITVIRPLRKVEVGRMETDTGKLTRLYEEGFNEGEDFLSRKTAIL